MMRELRNGYLTSTDMEFVAVAGSRHEVVQSLGRAGRSTVGTVFGHNVPFRSCYFVCRLRSRVVLMVLSQLPMLHTCTGLLKWNYMYLLNLLSLGNVR